MFQYVNFDGTCLIHGGGGGGGVCVCACLCACVFMHVVIVEQETSFASQ
jgi:hypothetical protein